MVKQALILGLLLGAQFAEAQSLRVYRDIVGSRTKMEAAAKERSNRLRNLLSEEAKNAPIFTALTDPQGPFVKVPAGSDSGRKVSSSYYVKSQLMEAAEALYRAEKRGKPPTFDPSMFVTEVDQKMAALRKQFCESKVVQKFPSLISEYAGHLIRNSSKTGAGTTVDAMERERIRLTSEYIRTNSPTYTWKNKQWGILDALGDIERVEFVDEHVIRVTFARRTSEGKTIRVPLSFSTLVTYRTDRDRYFLVIQNCLADYVTERIDGKRKGPEAMGNLEAVHADLQTSRVGAEEVHRGLASLNKRQLDFLARLFLQFRGVDIPVDDEMVSAGEEGANVSVMAHLAKRQTEAAAVKDTTTSEELFDDYRFYRALHQQLYEFEDYLVEERDSNAQSSVLVRDLKEYF